MFNPESGVYTRKGNNALSAAISPVQRVPPGTPAASRAKPTTAWGRASSA